MCLSSSEKLELFSAVLSVSWVVAGYTSGMSDNQATTVLLMVCCFEYDTISENDTWSRKQIL